MIDPELPQGKDDVTVGTKIIYDLIGVSNHMGSTGGGHYTAYCKYFFHDLGISARMNGTNLMTAMCHM